MEELKNLTKQTLSLHFREIVSFEWPRNHNKTLLADTCLLTMVCACVAEKKNL